MQNQIKPPFGILQAPLGSTHRFGKLAPRCIPAPHRLKIGFSKALFQTLSVREDLPPGFSCKLMEPTRGNIPEGPRPHLLEKFERSTHTIQLDLADVRLPLGVLPGHTTSLPPLIMLFPGNTVLLPFPLQSLEDRVAKTKLRQLFYWLEQQRDLATDRYSELWRIRGFALFYAKIKEMALTEMRLIKEYRNGWDRMHAYRLFSFQELSDLELSYAQILMAGICTMDRLLEVTASVGPPVGEDTRLPAVGDTAEELDTLYQDLIGINEELADVSRLRRKSTHHAAKGCPVDASPPEN